MSSAMKAQLERSMKAAKPCDRITLLVLQPQPRAVFWELTLPHREESHSGSRAVVDLSPQAGGNPAQRQGRVSFGPGVARTSTGSCVLVQALASWACLRLHTEL